MVKEKSPASSSGEYTFGTSARARIEAKEETGAVQYGEAERGRLTPELDIAGFFKALAASDPDKQEEARTYLKVAFDPATLLPSPRAKVFVESGEWESSNVALLKYTKKTLGRICRSEVGRSGVDSVKRFCGMQSQPNGSCIISAHTGRNRIQPLEEGYYISTSKKPYPERFGVLSTPMCPVNSDLITPFDARVEDALLDKEAPFCLSPGQWKYVFEEVASWRAHHGILLGNSSGGEDAWTAVEHANQPDGNLKPPPGVLTQKTMIDGAPFPAPGESRAAPIPEASKQVWAELQALKATIEAKEKLSRLPLQVDTQFPATVEMAGKQVTSPMSGPEEDITDRLSVRVQVLEEGIRVEQGRIETLCGHVASLMAEKEEAVQAVQDAMALVQFMQRDGATTQQGPPVDDGARIRLECRAVEVENKVDKNLQAVYNLREDVLGENGTVPALRRQIQDIADKMDHGGVTFGHYMFASPKDFLKWMDRQAPRLTVDYGLFVDIFSLLHMVTPGTVTHGESLKTEHDQKKVDYKSAVQSKVSTSFETSYPDVLGPADPTGQRFGRSLDGHDKWYNSDTNQGLAVTITDELDCHFDSMTELINDQLSGNELRHLAKDMLVESKRFFTELNKFLEEFHGQLKGGGGLSASDAWDITRRCFEQIFKDIRVGRGVVKHTRLKTPYLHIWGALKAHEIMRRYQSLKFRDDPALTGLLIRFLLKNQKESTATSLNSKVSGNVNKISSLNNDVIKLRRDVAALKEKE